MRDGIFPHRFDLGNVGDGVQQLAEGVSGKEQAKPQQRDVRRRAHRPRRAKAASVPQRPFNLFEALFGGAQYRYPQAPGSQQAAQGYGAQSAQNQYQQPGYAAQSIQNQYHLQAPTEPYPMLRQHLY